MQMRCSLYLMHTAKKTMTEFKGLELVRMVRININSSNSEYKIILNSKFNWFLTDFISSEPIIVFIYLKAKIMASLE